MSGNLTRQQPAQRRRHQHCHEHKQGAGRNRQQEKQAESSSGCKSESKISQVWASTQSISMNAGKAGRKNSTDTAMAVTAKSNACAQRQPKPELRTRRQCFLNMIHGAAPARLPRFHRREFAVAAASADCPHKLARLAEPRVVFQHRIRIHDRIALQDAPGR